MYIHKNLVLSIIINYRGSTAIELLFKPCDLLMTKEQSVSTEIMKLFLSEIVLLQHFVLNVYKISLYFPEHKLAVEVEENRHRNRDKHKENDKVNVIKNILVVKFIRINPNEKHFNIFVDVANIHNHITKSSIDKILC